MKTYISGFVKGTPIELQKGIYRIEQNIDVDQVALYSENSVKKYIKPISINWAWIPYFYTIILENDYLKLSRDQKVRTNHGWKAPPDLFSGDLLLKDSGYAAVLSVKKIEVLAPIFSFVFITASNVILAKKYLALVD